MKTIHLILMVLLAANASAQLIVVREELGLYGYVGGSYVLEHNAGPFNQGSFLWEYTNHTFTITALYNFDTEFWGNDLLAIYPFGVTPISIFDEALFSIESNELGIVRLRSFPSTAGETYSIPIAHPDFAVAIPEPSTWTAAGIIALTAACFIRRFRSRHHALASRQRSASF